MKGNETEKELLEGRMLVAEDNNFNFLLLKAIFKGYNLVRAMNGAEAVELLKEFSFDFVLIDIRMPVMNGLEATIKIREYNKHIPIIAITANAYDSDITQAIDVGCNGFLVKPFKKEELFNLLNELKE